MVDLNKTINKETDGLHGIAARLNKLAQAFAMTGNLTMSEDLTYIAEDISAHSANISDAYSKEVRYQFDETQKQIGKTLRAAMK